MTPRTPTVELILDCARANLDAARTEQVRQRVQSGNIDWANLLQTALEHGVLPLVYKAIDRVGIEDVPEPQRYELRQMARGNTSRNLLLFRELLKILTAMTFQNLRPMPYKGPLLAMLAYGDLSLRQSGDLDILVPQADLTKARNILEELGYQLHSDLANQDEAAHMASPHEYDFVYGHPQHKVDVELHWEIAGKFFSFQPDPVDLWNRSVTQSVMGAKLRLLCDEDLFLILCAHGTKHFWTRLTWICDIAQFLKTHPSLDWPTLMKRADEFDARSMVHLALLLSQRLLNSTIPQTAMTRLRPAIKKQAQELDERLFLTPAERDSMPKGGRAQLTDGGFLESLLFQCRTRESWGSAIKYFFYRAFAPTVVDRAWVHLPRPLSFMYYLVRPVRLTWKSLFGRSQDEESHTEGSH